VNGSSQCIFIHLGPLFPEFLKIKTTLPIFEVHMAMTMKGTILWHVTPCSLVHHLGNKIVLDFYEDHLSNQHDATFYPLY